MNAQPSLGDLQQAVGTLSPGGPVTPSFERLAGSAPIGIFVTDAAGRCTYANPRLGVMTGMSPESMLGDGWAATIRPQDRAAVLAGWRDWVAHGLEVDRLLHFVHSDGSPHAGRIRLTPILDDGSRLRGYVGMVEDLTAAEADRRTLEMHSRILRELADGVTVMDDRGRIVFVNAAMQRMFGYTPAELLGMNVSQINGDSEQRKRELMVIMAEEALRDGSWAGELNSLRKDGSRFVSRAVATPFDLDGARHWITIRQDVTAEKQLEARILQRSQAEQQAVAAQLHEGVGQDLTALALAIRAFRASPGGDADVAEFLGDIEARLNETIESTRRAAESLSAFALDDGDLGLAIGRIASDCERRLGVRCDVDVRDTADALDDAQRHQLFHVLRESVNSAVRHRGATRIGISVRPDSRGLVADVLDNGSLQVLSRAATRVDVEVLRHRAALIGATVEFGTQALGLNRLTIVLGSPRGSA
jgi:PAS domain S-box-containing protein